MLQARVLGRRCRVTVARRVLPLVQARLFSDNLGLDEVIVTKNCAKQILQVAKKQGNDKVHLRLAVDGGGCSGFQYVFEMDSKEIGEDDRVFERDGAKVVIDEMSMEFVTGATIDFETEMIRSGFAVLNNPNAEAGCGCGASFNLKE